MPLADSFTFADPGLRDVTADVVRRFIATFQQKDAAAIPDLVADDCVMEVMQPAPDGQRVEGYDANVRFWQAMVRDSDGTFETEEVVVCGDRAINRWRYRFGPGAQDSVRGVTLIRVRNGKITEALAYAKTTPRTALGQEAL
jgi:ketosteroid isomerase-like protein